MYQSLLDMATRHRSSLTGVLIRSRMKESATTNNISTLASARSRSDSVPNKTSPQQRRPPVGMRQASIGIRRTPSSNALRQVAQQPNVSTQRLNAPLPALEEDHVLGEVQSNHGSESTLTGSEPAQGRLGKFKSVVQTKIPFWGNKDKGKGKTTGSDAHGATQDDSMSMCYTSDMVDVLDTIGMS